MHVQQRLAQRSVAPPLFGGRVHFRKRDADLLREHPHGVLKADLLVQLEELEHVAAGAAAEAVEEAFVRMDDEGRRLLAVKRTVALVRRAGTLERYVLLDDGEDVRLHAQVVDELLRK